MSSASSRHASSSAMALVSARMNHPVLGIISSIASTSQNKSISASTIPIPMPRTFYIIDGNAHIYRSYFAPFRDLTSPTGEPTKATFVFTQMLLNLIDQRKPDYLAMVIDSGDETVFRTEFFPEYKKNRTAPPDDFRPQEQRILQIVRDAGVPI